MKAADARELKIDDRVTIRFSNGNTRVGVISRIDWPQFTVALVDGKNRRYYRTRKYKSLHHVTKEDRVPTEFLKPQELPSWLQFPVNEDYEIAADLCDDQGLESTARVLRDSRCDPNQLRNIDSIVVNRDKPHMDELRGALPFLLNEFPAAHDKLSRYVERLTELQNIGTGFRDRRGGLDEAAEPPNS